MADLDPNAWYRLSETRVDNSTGPFALNLQLRTGTGLRVHPISDGKAAWQFQPYGGVKGRYFMRLDQVGVKQQLAVCHDPTEPTSGNTVACMQDSATVDSQLWDVSDFGSGTFKFVNVGNGSSYVLDVHPNSNLFMSSEIEGSPSVAEKQPAQHWVMSSISAVNDGAYSTIYSSNVAVSTSSASLSSSSTTTRPTTTFTTTRPTQTTAMAGLDVSAIAMGATASNSTVSASKGISTAAGAGIGVAVALSVVGLIGAVAFFWWRRSQRPAKTKYSEVEAKNGDVPDRSSSIGISPNGESAPSSLHGISPTVGVSSLSSWQPASSVSVPPVSSFINGQQQQTGYYVGGQQPVQGGQQGGYYGDQQQTGYYIDPQTVSTIGGQQAVVYIGGHPSTVPEQQPTTYIGAQIPAVAQPAGSYASGQHSDSFDDGDAPIASLYGQRIRSLNIKQQSGASIYGQRTTPSSASASLYGQSTGASSSPTVLRHQFDHPTAATEFAPGAAKAVESYSASRGGYGTNQNQTSSTVNLADFEPMPQPHELETAERDIVRRQHELGSFHHGPDTFMNNQTSRARAASRAASTAPKAELSAYQHGPDTFTHNEAKMLGAPTAELGAYQHGPDTFENEHEAKVLGVFHPGTESFAREREDKVLGNLHDIMSMAKPAGRGGAEPQSYEMSPMRPSARDHGDTNR
ncbi:transmembrane alpha-helix domain-containing protein [Colletotrichum truncatum]|uniref:Transmembrane alpha-helix domain-containing protein n=1 Tax=Colletotrichum truncatum TaxID=5467 RepID=A0ACC3ZI28_COLTU|nr:transmembrane alpha-helix domain-containing protein [Colletotrichum truncatum]KAF6786702.1 transmembrane alpha-helix domain-containing protein [Colletotrichum truncatum]